MTYLLMKKPQAILAGPTKPQGLRKSTHSCSGGSKVNVQAKLIVGPPHDRFEQEADRVAEQVMRSASAGEPILGTQEAAEVEPVRPFRGPGLERGRLQCAPAITALRSQRVAPSGVGELVQRKCSQCESDEELQRASRGDAEATPAVATVTQGTIERLKPGGQPLDNSVRAFMETRFQRDFSAVRIHADAETTKVARSLNARAFTVGRNIFFDHDEFRPSSSAGKKLLAHELTHAVQQTGAVQTIQRSVRSEEEPASTSDAINGAADTRTDAASGNCPRREANERRWAKAQPVTLDYDLNGTDEGFDVRRWYVSGFPIDEAKFSSAQGDVIGAMLPLFKRLDVENLKHTGLSKQSHERSKNLPIECTEYRRVVKAMGSGDCHAPELNTALKNARVRYMAALWPRELEKYFWRSSASLAAKDEARYGEFPAGTNATREDRAKNRAVMFTEFVFPTRLVGEQGEAEAEAKAKRQRVARDFPDLYGKALEQIENDLARCVLSRVRFRKDGRPLETDQDAYLNNRPQIMGIPPGSTEFPEGSRHLGTMIFEEAMNQNIMKDLPGDPTLAVCGVRVNPDPDPVARLRHIMMWAFHDVMLGVNMINGITEGQYGVSLPRWLSQMEQRYTVYSCWPGKGHFLDGIDKLNPKRVADAIKGMMGSDDDE